MSERPRVLRMDRYRAKDERRRLRKRLHSFKYDPMMLIMLRTAFRGADREAARSERVWISEMRNNLADRRWS